MLMGLLAGLGMLGVLVVVHEFGHFIVAKLFKVGVPVFSVGMGPRVFGFVRGGTDYRLSLFPVGGYVRMAGADPFGEEDNEAMVDEDEDFMKKPVWQRLLVMLAGPGFNLLLPFVLFTAVLMGGEPQGDTSIGAVLPDSLASESGLEPGDRVVAIDGEPVEIWLDVADAFVEPRTVPMNLEVERRGQRLEVAFPAHQIPVDERGEPDLDVVGIRSWRASARVGVDDPASPAGVAGLRIGDAISAVDGKSVRTWVELEQALGAGGTHEISYLRAVDGEVTSGTASLAPDPTWAPPTGDPAATTWGLTPVMLYVGGVAPESPASAAGVQAGDRIVAIDGQIVRHWADLTRYVAATAEGMQEGDEPRALKLQLLRDGEPLTLDFAPRIERTIIGIEVIYRPVMGIQQYPDAFVPGPTVKKYYSITEAVPRAAYETWALGVATIKILGNLFTGDMTPRETLGGPVAIFTMAGQGAERGIYSYVRMIGTISISLAIFNLLPVPVLDGGQILFYSIEGIRGRPLSIAVREKLQMAGVLGLVALMLVVTVFDVNRWWTGG